MPSFYEPLNSRFVNGIPPHSIYPFSEILNWKHVKVLYIRLL